MKVVETQLTDSLHRRTLHSILRLSNYKAINVLSGELYQGDPDLY